MRDCVLIHENLFILSLIRPSSQSMYFGILDNPNSKMQYATATRVHSEMGILATACWLFMVWSCLSLCIYLCDCANVSTENGKGLLCIRHPARLATCKTTLSSIGDRVLSAASPILWNSFRPEIRNSDSFTIKSHHKTHLFSLTYHWLVILDLVSYDYTAYVFVYVRTCMLVYTYVPFYICGPFR